MVAPRTPNFVLHHAVVISVGPYDTFTLEPGTFVRPIELQYIPQHVLDNPRWKGYDMKVYVFVYTSKGILPVLKSAIREV